jgi:hypothetical protein
VLVLMAVIMLVAAAFLKCPLDVTGYQHFYKCVYRRQYSARQYNGA